MALSSTDSRSALPANIALRLAHRASASPQAVALSVAERGGFSDHTFADLHHRSARYAAGLEVAGVGAGTRVLVMITPGIEFVTVVFGLMLVGAVPVLIDPGMGVRPLLRCIRQVAPEVLIGIPRAVVARHLFRRAFRSVRLTLTVGRRGLVLDLPAGHHAATSPGAVAPDDLAAILFTSGSTGPAKGVMYTHAMFAAQVQALDDMFAFRAGDVQVATFPLFALFCPALGLRCVIPDMDASRPGQADPARIVDAIERHRATSAFGSPALWRRVVQYCERHALRLDSLRQVLAAGAPVPADLVARLRALVPEGDVYTPYGATEALPVCIISGAELADGRLDAATRGAGICVGRPVEPMVVRVIEAVDEPLDGWRDDLALAAGAIGELVVRGPVVTRAYYERPEATARAKIADGTAVWHRMGDVGYVDDLGLVWFCGRKAHRVHTTAGVLYSVRCEAVFNTHPRVARSALVGVGVAPRQRPVIIIEPVDGVPRGTARAVFVAELVELARDHELTASINTILFRKRLPVDARHNAKINREWLARWAARHAGGGDHGH